MASPTWVSALSSHASELRYNSAACGKALSATRMFPRRSTASASTRALALATLDGSFASRAAEAAVMRVCSSSTGVAGDEDWDATEMENKTARSASPEERRRTRNPSPRMFLAIPATENVMDQETTWDCNNNLHERPRRPR